MSGMMARFVAAKMIHVRYPMLVNAMGVMKTMLPSVSQVWTLIMNRICGTYTKLSIQFALVLMALAGPRIGKGTIST